VPRRLGRGWDRPASFNHAVTKIPAALPLAQTVRVSLLGSARCHSREHRGLETGVTKRRYGRAQDAAAERDPQQENDDDPTAAKVTFQAQILLNGLKRRRQDPAERRSGR